ncbi:glycerate kinase family protein [Hamadaea tsunoensis]|uniref:glycerate kinase family protein n=1 Tax=Hamadaea tsunoensis TaxID=53368 RepID=UPI0004044257|nr:glycerate kinase [Hamadaea tsunoensis]
MRVLICPDKFAGTLSAAEAAEAVAAGWRRVRPADELVRRPLADGGPGFVDVLAAAQPSGKRFPVRTADPLGRPVDAEIFVLGDTAYAESAQACGLHHLKPAGGPDRRDPLHASSVGLTALLLAAAGVPGVRRIVVGLGGSGTNDAGVEMLAALGHPEPARAFGRPDPGRLGSLDGVELIGATDVDNPLTGPRGATRVFGPQKGATGPVLDDLEAALVRVAAVLGPQVAETPGAGAAGGLGAALLALGGRLVSGITLVREATGLDAEIARADLVITGEGSFDEQSLHGKVIDGVAGTARRHEVPCYVLAGRSTVSAAEAAGAGVTAVESLVDTFGTDRALHHAEESLILLAAQVAGRFPPR